MSSSPQRTVVGIDIGTSKIAVLVAALDASGALSLVSGAQVPARGLRNGVVVDLDAVSASLTAALDRTEELYGAPIEAAYVNVGGVHLESSNTHSMVTLTPAGRDVTSADIGAVVTSARAALSFEENHELIHLIPRGYVLDGQGGIRNPVGMAGCALGVETHAVMGATTHIQNLTKCLREAEVEVRALVMGPLAAGTALLTREDDALSIAVADIGAETTGVAIYAEGAVWLSAVLPGGSASITRDIALELRLSLAAAESLKRRHGSADAHQVADDDLIELEPFTGANEVVPRALLVEIIQARVLDLAETLRAPLRAAEHAGIRPARLLLAGGAAELPGLDAALSAALSIPTELVRPSGIRGLQGELERPSFAVAAGLVQWGARQTRRTVALAPARAPRVLVPGLFAGLRRWVTTQAS